MALLRLVCCAVAGFPLVSSLSFDCSGAPGCTTATGLGTIAPRSPRCPFAVHRASLRMALFLLGGVATASLAAELSRCLNFPSSFYLCSSARHGARRPLRPRLVLAVDRAVLRAAVALLLSRTVTILSPMLGLVLDTFPYMIASTAALRALTPILPFL